MEIAFFCGIIVLLLLNLIFILKISVQKDKNIDVVHKLEEFSSSLEVLDRNIKQDFSNSRMESADAQRIIRSENQNTIISFQSSINEKLDTMAQNTQDSITGNFKGFMDTVFSRLDAISRSIQDVMGQQNEIIRNSFSEMIRNNDQKLGQMRDAVEKNQASSIESLSKFADTVSGKIDVLTKTTQETLDKQNESVQNSFREIMTSNEKKLEEMRLTVDEKLQSTLEKRLSSSFEQVSKQLEAVQKGLGTMQNLASDVGGLKRALTNVKNAGTFGEVRLETLLSDVLSPEQFEKNAHPNPSDSKKVVEFAVKIPSKNSDKEFIYLPVDSKYPAAVWDNLTAAYENGDKDEIESLRKTLSADIKKFARDIHDKYIESPYTTEFGVMFLPFEGLYSEVIRIPGLFTFIQETYHVTIAGPTTLNAFLNSLQMGFRTLAIQKESSKVWELLGAVKTQFCKFGEVLAKTKEKLNAATKEIENAEQRSNIIEKKLCKIDTLDKPDSGFMLE